MRVPTVVQGPCAPAVLRVAKRLKRRTPPRQLHVPLSMGPVKMLLLALPLTAAVDPCPPAPGGAIASEDEMTAEEVEAWALGSPSFARFAPVLREQEVDLVTLSSVSNQDLVVAGLPLGVAFKLKRCAEELLAAAPDMTGGTVEHQPGQQKTATEDAREQPLEPGIVSRALQEVGACNPAAVEAMADSCCPSSKGHRRAQSVHGCDALPEECAPGCAQMFMSFYEQCQMMVGSLGDQAAFERFYSQCQAAAPTPPAPAPTPDHCVDSATWVSDIGSAGCGQYGPGETSWQPMCAAHLGQYVDQRSAAMATEESAQAVVMFAPAKVTAAEACPVSCGLCPSCDDGKQNGGEVGIDCGGPCSACVVRPSCGPIENSGLVGPNLRAICTGQGTGDTCFTQPAPGFQPSTPGVVAQQCADPSSECGAELQSMLAVVSRNALPGHFRCTETGRWEGESLHVLPIVPTVCPPQVSGDHYSGNCESSSEPCMASCDEGYPVSRGDGVFTCRAGVWIGDLVCKPITCGITLDKISPAESAFSVCTEGDTLGSTCTAFCREGYYSTVGTGVGSFECTDHAGGLWMQQGFSPWWESSLQCTRCPRIENCHVSSCTTGNDAQCSQCEQGFYAFRHDEEPTRCLPVSVTMQAAGFTAEATGIFSFRFAGSVPSDLSGGELTVPAEAALSITGTRVETVSASFVVDGALDIGDVRLPAGTLQRLQQAQGSINIHDVQLTDAGGQVCQSVDGSSMGIAIHAACLSLACASSPCQNGGTCIPSSVDDGYTCDCVLGYGGPCNSAVSFDMKGWHDKSIPSCSVFDGDVGGSQMYPVSCVDGRTPDVSTINDCAAPGGNCEIRFPAVPLPGEDGYSPTWQMNDEFNDPTGRGCCSAMRCSGGPMCMCDVHPCSVGEDATHGEQVRSSCTSGSCETTEELSDGRTAGMRALGECDPRC